MLISIKLLSLPQARVHAELDLAFGRDRPASVSERDSTPYTEAVLHEVQRRGNILSISVPHRTEREVNIGQC